MGVDDNLGPQAIASAVICGTLNDENSIEIQGFELQPSSLGYEGIWYVRDDGELVDTIDATAFRSARDLLHHLESLGERHEERLLTQS